LREIIKRPFPLIDDVWFAFHAFFLYCHLYDLTHANINTRMKTKHENKA
jgi:hypothetical protein